MSDVVPFYQYESVRIGDDGRESAPAAPRRASVRWHGTCGSEAIRASANRIPRGACTPQQLEQSCPETADWSRVQVALLQLQPFLPPSAFSTWYAGSPQLGELTTVGDGAKDVLKEISPRQALWEEKLLDEAKVCDLEALL